MLFLLTKTYDLFLAVTEVRQKYHDDITLPSA